MACLTSLQVRDVLGCQMREEEAKKPKKGSEIPIPMVRTLPAYERDYLPVFREQPTYIRGRGMLDDLCQSRCVTSMSLTPGYDC